MDFINAIDARILPIEYGWVDRDEIKHNDAAQFSEKCVLQSPEQLLKSRLGVCLDMVFAHIMLF